MKFMNNILSDYKDNQIKSLKLQKLHLLFAQPLRRK